MSSFADEFRSGQTTVTENQLYRLSWCRRISIWTGTHLCVSCMSGRGPRIPICLATKWSIQRLQQRQTAVVGLRGQHRHQILII